MGHYGSRERSVRVSAAQPLPELRGVDINVHDENAMTWSESQANSAWPWTMAPTGDLINQVLPSL